MYQALYRKYRPLTFGDVVGQRAIVKILKNSIGNNQIGHAYMFFGPRGTGKTSLAKIFARTINCENAIDGEICLKCNSCKETLCANTVDIIEIDAASNNGVDEIRELKSKINLVPNQLKYKVYIIDEVHMLSIGAFNALLKTLEEPPEHIVFILATTDPQKVPETIKSRCQCFNFQRINDQEIVDKLTKICFAENIEVEEKVLQYIAISSNGGLRDSLSMLDMLYSACGKNILMEDYIELNDLIDDSTLISFLCEILNGNIDEVLLKIEQFNSSGKNLIQICELLLQKSRDYVIDYYCGKNELEINFKFLEQFAFLLNDKMYDIRKSSNPRVYIEILFLKFIHELMEDCEISKDKIISREIILEQKFDRKETTVSEKEDNQNLGDLRFKEGSEEKQKESFDNTDIYDRIEDDFLDRYREVMTVRVNNTFCKADKNILLQVKEKFTKLKEYVFDQKIGYLICALMDGTVRVASEENIVISLEYPSMIDANLKNIDQLQTTLQQITQLTQKLAFITDETWNMKKQEYIQKLQSGENFEYAKEPVLPTIVERKDKNDEMVDHAVELFGDIVEKEEE